MVRPSHSLLTTLLGVQLLACAWRGARAYDVVTISQQMQADADKLVAYGKGNRLAYDRLAYLTDTFGPRFSGSSSLEEALTWVSQTAAADGGLVITEQPVLVTHWERGNEWARMISPRNKALHFLGLGMSNNTGGVNVTAEVMVVKSYAELVNRSGEVKGKIVLYNVAFTTYSGTVGYRSMAANWTAQYGGVGALIRSVGPYSMQTPHTGGSMTAAIAAGAVSLEDATQMQRMVDRGQKVVVSMYMEAQEFPDTPSRNILIDLVGSTKPNEYVLVGGHMDSWDVAEGAMDDGGGAFASWHALRMMVQLGLKPQRTIRAIMFVNEENGNKGGKGYAAAYASTLNSTSIAIEADEGAFSPYALGFSGHAAAMVQLQALSPLLSALGADAVNTGGGGTDIGPVGAMGVPLGSPDVLDPRLTKFSNNPCFGLVDPTLKPDPDAEQAQYFWFHHTAADTIDRMDPQQIQDVATFLAIWTYTIANLPELLPRSGPVPVWPPADPAVHPGAVAGGVIGGFIALAVTMGVIVHCRRKYLKNGWRSGITYTSVQHSGYVSGAI